jgi:MFS family permease
MMVGILFGGCVTEKIGCLWTLRVSLIMEFIGWIAIFFAQNFGELMIGRILTGLGSGLSTPASYLILTDLSLIRFRGNMAVLNSSANNLGWLVGLILGRLCPINHLILLYSFPPMLFLFLSPLLPESPLWLTKQGRPEMAKKSLKFVRGAQYPVEVSNKIRKKTSL